MVMVNEETYTKDQLEKLFQLGVSRGLVLYGMVMNGQSDKKSLDLLSQIFPDFEGALKKCTK